VSDTGRTDKIVLIEDDPDIAALVDGILSDAGHTLQILAEMDGSPADASVRLVITDLVAIRSYDENAARDWITKVRARYPKAAVVISTAHAPAAQGGAAALGADAVLVKPFDVGRFTEVVESLLGH
jgi:DNA-binding response OmpR family regulator